METATNPETDGKTRKELLEEAELVAEGNRVDLQTRLQDDSPTLHQGTITKVREDGCFEVTLDGSNEVVHFNPYGICMPWNRQLQIKI